MHFKMPFVDVSTEHLSFTVSLPSSASPLIHQAHNLCSPKGLLEHRQLWMQLYQKQIQSRRYWLLRQFHSKTTLSRLVSMRISCLLKVDIEGNLHLHPQH